MPTLGARSTELEVAGARSAELEVAGARSAEVGVWLVVFGAASAPSHPAMARAATRRKWGKKEERFRGFDMPTRYDGKPANLSR
jgi:hypothetical protein